MSKKDSENVVGDAKEEFYLALGACVNEYASKLSFAELIGVLGVKESELKADLSFSMLQSAIKKVE